MRELEVWKLRPSTVNLCVASLRDIGNLALRNCCCYHSNVFWTSLPLDLGPSLSRAWLHRIFVIGVWNSGCLNTKFSKFNHGCGMELQQNSICKEEIFMLFKHWHDHVFHSWAPKLRVPQGYCQLVGRRMCPKILCRAAEQLYPQWILSQPQLIRSSQLHVLSRPNTVTMKYVKGRNAKAVCNPWSAFLRKSLRI